MIYTGDSLKILRTLADESVQCAVTSPPYFRLRDYGVKGQIGLERTIPEYLARLVEVFREVRRVLRDDGTLWVNMGDSYANDTKWGGVTGGRHAMALHGAPVGRVKVQTGLKAKDLMGMPWRLAFALQDDGWYLRSDIIWHKPNPMPDSVKDRPTKSHEYLFLLAKSERYYYDGDAIKEPTTGNAHDRARKDRPDKWPNAWSAEEGRHDGIGNGRFTAKGKPGVNPKARFHASGQKERKLADGTDGRLDTHLGRGVPWPPEIRPKQNESFSAAVTRTVERRNKRTVWTLPTKPYSDAHFATFPPKLIEPCILAGSRMGDVVLDCFMGAGTTGLVAREHGRQFIGIELNPAYVRMAKKRIGKGIVLKAATA
jgi:DNA modification methylase